MNWLASVLPFIKDAKVSDVLKEHVALLQAQRDDAIKELDKADRELAAERQKTRDLLVQIDDLRKKIGNTSDLHDEAVAILSHFFELDTELTATPVAKFFDLKTSVAKHHFDSLRERKFIQQAQAIRFAGQETKFRITPAGRSFMVNLKAD